MTLLDLMMIPGDRDVSDDVFDYLPLCVSGPIQVTEEGRDEWRDVLRLPVTAFDEHYAVVSVDDPDEDIEERRALRLQRFLRAQAGYCSEKDFDRWFILM